MSILDEINFNSIEHLHYFLDESKQLTISDILNKQPNWGNLIASKGKVGITDKAMWFKISVYNPSNDEKSYQWEIDHGQLEVVDIYYVQDSKVIARSQTGTQFKRPERTLSTVKVADEFQLGGKQTTDVYFRITSDFYITIPIKVGPSKQMAERRFFMAGAVFVFIGVMISMAFYNVAIAISTKDFSYYFYILYIIAMTGYITIINGYDFGTGLFQNPAKAIATVITLTPTVFIFALAFTYHFLNLKKLGAIFHYMALVLVVILLASIFVGRSTNFETWVAIMNPLVPLVILLVIISAAYAWYRRVSGAMYYLMAWVSMSAGVIIHELWLNGVIGHSWFTEVSLQMGTAIEIILLSWALSTRIKKVREDKELAERQTAIKLSNANRQLSQALEIKEQSNLAKDEFLRLVSHELRTPLNTVVSALDLLKVNIDHSPYLTDVEQGSRRLLSHVENLVLLSEVNTGKAFDIQKRFLTQRLLDRIKETVAVKKADKTHIEFELQVLGDQPDFLVGDEEKLYKIISNVLDNAIKFTTQGRIVLKMRGDYISNELIGYQIIIDDSGIGMTSEQLDQVYESFNQVDSSFQRQIEGLGMGLTVAKRLAELLSVEMKIESKINLGTQVYLRFQMPCIKYQSIETVPVPSQQTPVLVVEDNLVNAKLLCALLKKMGLHSHHALDGRIAVDMSNDQLYDLVLMDLQMPNMDGWQACELIRQSQNKESVIIAITANATSEDQERCKNAGMDAFMKKPVRFKNLREVLQQYVKVSEPC